MRIIVAVLYDELPVGPKELLQHGQLDSTPHDALVADAQFEQLQVDVLHLGQPLDYLLGLARVAHLIVQVGLQRKDPLRLEELHLRLLADLLSRIQYL